MKGVINCLKNEDWARYNKIVNPNERCETILERIYEILPEFDYFSHKGIRVDTRDFFLKKFYRIRLKADIKDISNTDSYLYPPSKFCKTIGRVNYENHPVFIVLQVLTQRFMRLKNIIEKLIIKKSI